MRSPKKWAQKLNRRSSFYFSNFQKEIADKNLLMLRRLNLFSIALLLGYYVFALLYFHDAILNLAYPAILVSQIAILLYSQKLRRQKEPSYREVRAMCTLYIFLMVSFILIISVFAYPERPGIFFPIFMLLISVLFVLPFWYTVTLLTGFEALFSLLAFLFKTRVSFGYDFYGSITAWLLAILIAYFVLDLHLQEGKAQYALRLASATDVTTGLPNRRAFDQYIQKHYGKCQEEKEPIAVFLLDIDDFKQFNDHFGHVAGDECLHQIGSALLAYSKREDIFFARYGGEELIAVATGEKAAQSGRLAEGIRQCIRGCAVQAVGSVADYVTVSIGVAVAEEPQKELSYLELVKQADAALYCVKSSGKNGIHQFQKGEETP